MTEFRCDVCGRRHSDSTKRKWFTIGVEVIPTLTRQVTPEKGPHITIWQWPTGCRLQQPHDALYHVCSVRHAMEKAEQILLG
jgi:hypothetical protein